MTGLTIVLGVAVITTMILKFSHKARPRAFWSDEETSDSLLSQCAKEIAKNI